MLEQMRKSSQSLLIYLLFGIVIAVFIVNFGPQSGGGCSGEAPGAATFAARVNGRTLTTNDFRYGFMILGGSQLPPQLAKQRRLKEAVMDKLIERELLAAEARRLGFEVTDDEVEDQIAESRIVGLGYPRSLARLQKDGRFDYESFKRFVLYELGLTPKTFIEEQKQELLAFRVRELLRDAVKISPDEVKADYVRKGNQVNVEYVRISPRRYEAEMDFSPAEIAAFAKATEDKLRKLYEERKFLYQKAPRELRLRRVLVKVDAGASPAAEEAARKRAEALLARVEAGAPFAQIAHEASEDARTKARGGALGWRRKGASGLGAAADERLFGGKPGEGAKDGDVVGPVRGKEGFDLVSVEASREGDIPFEKAELDLAEEQLRQDKAQARARAEADSVVAKAKAESGKTLKDLFPGKSGEDEEGEREPFGAALKAEETGPFARRGDEVEGIGVSRELAKAVFDLTPDKPLGGPYDVSGSYVVVRLKEKKEADMKAFEEKRTELVRDAELVKWEDVLGDFAQRRCQEAKERKQIEVNRDVLRYDEGPEAPAPYEPCAAPLRL